jgi:DHA1 family tetracycline resistance protein-like MFS transporter
VGGALGGVIILGRPGVLAAFVAAGLSLINLVLAFVTLPESLPPAARGKSRRRLSPLDFAQIRAAVALPGVGQAMAINFVMIFWFAGMEQTFRLFTEDRFGMSDRGTGLILGLVGVVSATVQGGLISRLSRAFGEARLVRAGMAFQAIAFALLGLCPRLGALALVGLFASAALIALGNGLVTPSLPAFVSRRVGPTAQGMTLGSLQSASALARVLGPAAGGFLYQTLSPSAPYFLGALGFVAAAALASRLVSLPPAPSPSASASASAG